MYLKILHSLKGVVRVRLSGHSPERFFNLCSAGNIEIWDLEYENGVCRFSMTLPDFFKIRAYARKANVRLVIAEKWGLPFFMQRNQKRAWYGAGLFCFFVLLYTLSLFIWDITFLGNYHYTEDTLTDFLNDKGIACGIRKGTVSCEELESSVRSAFPEITWVSARISGTRLIIQVKENEVLSQIPVKNETACDIVADYDGIITYMIVRSGIPQAAIGDEVKKGQVLVRGAVPITDDNGETIGENLVCADADIRAKTNYQYQKTFPILHKVLSDTGNVRKGLMVKIGNFSAKLMVPAKKDTLWRTTMFEHQAKLFGDFYLPVWWGTITSRETNAYERIYTEKEMEEKGTEIHKNFLHNLSEKGVHIIENNVKILKDGSLCHVRGNAVGDGPIGYLKPTDIPMENETDQTPVLEDGRKKE